MYILGMIVLIFFAIIGLCAFITAVIDAAHSSTEDEILIVLRKLTADNAESRIRKSARICMSTKGAGLICVCDSGEPAYSICEMMKRDHPFIEIVNSRSICDIFK